MDFDQKRGSRAKKLRISHRLAHEIRHIASVS